MSDSALSPAAAAEAPSVPVVADGEMTSEVDALTAATLEHLRVLGLTAEDAASYLSTPRGGGEGAVDDAGDAAEEAVRLLDELRRQHV